MQLNCEPATVASFIGRVPFAVAMFDSQMRYLIASAKWYEDYALVGQNIIGVSHYDVFPEMPEHWRSIHQRGLQGENLSSSQVVFNRQNGTSQVLKWEVKPWSDATGAHGIFIFTEDITRQKAVESAYNELQTLLEKQELCKKPVANLVPVCCVCKKIESEDHHWQRMEEYFNRRFDFTFTHGLCPKCMRKNYGFLAATAPVAESSSNRPSHQNHGGLVASGS